MATGIMGPLQRNEANYIFNNNRLLIGWFERENQKHEAWLGKALSSDGTRQGTGWRFYTSATSLEHTPVNKFHPALQAHFVEGNTAGFFSRRILLRFLKGWHEDVVKGRAKYSEHEGGELKTMTNGEMFPRHKVSNAPQGQGPEGGQKRKRDADGPEDPAKEKKANLYEDYYDNNEDDDEELPLYVKTEAPEVDAMNHIPTVLETATPQVQQPRPAQNQPQDQISASIANLGIADNVAPGNHKPADPKHTIQGVAKPDPMALTALAQDLQSTLIGHVIRWTKFTDDLKRNLKEPAGELCVAGNIGEVLTASRKILHHLINFHNIVEDVMLREQEYVGALRASGMFVNTNPGHEFSAMKNEALRRELKDAVENMAQRIEELQTGMM